MIQIQIPPNTPQRPQITPNTNYFGYLAHQIDWHSLLVVVLCVVVLWVVVVPVSFETTSIIHFKILNEINHWICQLIYFQFSYVFICNKCKEGINIRKTTTKIFFKNNFLKLYNSCISTLQSQPTLQNFPNLHLSIFWYQIW